MNLQQKTSFFEEVYEIVLLIPYGKVTTYGEIAKAIGSPGASRMVGWAMNASHKSLSYIPAHRVVNRNGLLTGKHHFIGENTMQQLLESEGIKIKNNKIENFKNHIWIPE